MRENEPALLVLSTYDGKLFLRKVKFYLRNVTIVDNSFHEGSPYLITEYSWFAHSRSEFVRMARQP